jgi:hypothetical protein
MALAVSEVRAVVQRVCGRPDVLAACRHNDIGFVAEARSPSRRRFLPQISHADAIRENCIKCAKHCL